jgi:ubiquinone/menaquinone biosynthesis C-methylase UbiE
MEKDNRKQYNNFSKKFSKAQSERNQASKEIMYEFVGSDLKNKSILDLCCGDGIDADYYSSLGAKVSGLDASGELISLAENNYSHIDFIVGLAEELPYENDTFDAVYSKYAIMTSKNMKPIFDEAYRVLKKGGVLVYLVVHPLRQFMERKNNNEDYFCQKYVESILFNGEVTVKEPTHTFNEYFNLDFFSKFEVVDYREIFDKDAESINGNVYPGFFIVKALKK